ncbi:hypothetical protein CHLNCDRAFT_58309 [Chlorella variabilis]|uniref:TPM domain-containing protein n=1 Tax=Chlorella variabilis TaxID=554065 RepID=E1ZJ18_CHLVA|nr:hypothetical protein CHLNCDRAFT_58309 [Chlorella variabilis]EFN54260.1 hypothetical protein CHLNCDRAFT_58309 [Chlorella variabilis]|eukprot:XP_005846362.1 hypothetical protein CHLNCDRAFT_58309 [Chlorella variabilis]
MNAVQLRQPAFVASTTAGRAQTRARGLVACRAQQQGPVQELGRKAAAAAAAALLAAAPLSGAALAGEFDLLAEGTPSTYVLDDAAVLNKTTKKTVGDQLKALEDATGYHLEVATVRRLEFENDTFAFGDKLVSKWYPGAAKDKAGVLIVVSAGKDGALTGGDAFMSALGDDLIDSVVGENIPILTGEEKYNETVTSSVSRVVARLTGKEDPGPPFRQEFRRERTYKTKAETEAKKPVTATIVVTLLVISGTRPGLGCRGRATVTRLVVPMLQYYGYTNKD